MLTTLIMGASTGLIGLLPTYETIGVAAPILLTLLRVCQGLGAGAEFGGASTLLCEHAPPHKRGYFSSHAQTGVQIGLLLGTLTFLLVERLGARRQPPGLVRTHQRGIRSGMPRCRASESSRPAARAAETPHRYANARGARAAQLAAAVVSSLSSASAAASSSATRSLTKDGVGGKLQSVSAGSHSSLAISW